MSRISIHLTVMSAALVVLALVAQSSGFGSAFRVLSIGLSAAILVLGTLTGIRVMNASNDDAAFLLGMNRIRAAYLELDPGARADHLVTSRARRPGRADADLPDGLSARSTLSHVAGSTGVFIIVDNSIVAGILGSLVTDASGAGVGAGRGGRRRERPRRT